MRIPGCIIFFLLLVNIVNAQQPVYRHITEDDGLPDNEIYYLYQDKKGITWISTNSGLCRYNGQSFQYYSNTQLKARSTGCITEDAYGRIWCTNFSGQLFYVEQDSLVIVHLPGNENINNSGYFAIGPQNQLVVAAEKSGLTIYKPYHHTKTGRPDYRIDTVLGQALGNAYFTKDGSLWSTMHTPGREPTGELLRYNHTKTTYYKYPPGYNNGVRNTGFVVDGHGNTLFFEREKSNLYTLIDGTIQPERRLNLPGFKMVVPLQNGRLAFCTNSGLFISDEKKPAPAIVTSLFAGQTISAFCEDANGNWWVGTLTEGLYFIPRLGLTSLVPGRPGIDYSNVTAICAGPAGQLIMGFLNGELGLLDSSLAYHTLMPANKLSNKVQSLFYSPRLQLLNWYADNIYQAGFSATTTRLQPYRGVGYASKDIAYIPQWNAALIANPVDIQLISLDREPIAARIDKGWATHYDTLSLFDKLMPWAQQSVLLSRERGRAVYADSAAGTLWGADKNGITVYSHHGKRNILLNTEPIYATTFCAYRGTVWTGSFSQGLVAIKNEQVVKQWLVKDGLASNTIYRIIAGNGHLWIYTDKGLQYFDIDRELFYLVDKAMGLPSYKINGTSLVNGRLFISTPKGLLYIPDSVTFTADVNRRAYLQAVYCNRIIVDTATSRFGPGQNSFVFAIETPVYSNRALLRYRYRLKGADRDYLVTTLDNAAFEYKSLQPGRYEFELTLTDTRGHVIGPPVLYAFTIQPPFYKAGWFILLCALLLCALIYWGVRARINRIQKRAAEKLQLAQMERDLNQSQLSGIKAQMNPHFMFNALNSIQEFILLNDKRQANMYMGKFADLMRMTLDMSNQKEVLLEDEIRMLQLYLELEALRFEESFTYTITVADNVAADTIYLPAMLIQPNVENAVKHGLLHKQGEKKLELGFAMQQPGLLCCTVTDNGIGRKRSGEINAQRLKKHTSFATGATQKRLGLLNYQKKALITVVYEDLHDAHGHAAGTRVVINIPV